MPYFIIALYFFCGTVGTLSLFSAINKWIRNTGNNFPDCFICSVCYGIIIASVVSKYILG